jgi:8-oxo-dGTP pyrophosphatase MutT (NUDIX family)
LELETLWQGKWISVVSPKDAPYEAIHEGDIVLVIPYLQDKETYGVRLEKCPPYSIKDTSGEDRYYTLISGKIEEGESDLEAALRETEEEAGIQIKEYKPTTIAKRIPVCKSTDMRATIFFIEVSEYDVVDAVGDGTQYEAESETVFLKEEQITEIIDNYGNYDLLLLFLQSMFEGEV